MIRLIENLNWRYATKKFDSNRKIEVQDLECLMEAIRLSVSSYGLQGYRVLVIENSEIRQKLREAAWNQSQLTDASHLFVFCNFTRGYDHLVDDYISRIKDGMDEPDDEIGQYGEFIKTKISEMSDDRRNSWAEKQTYLALNNLLIACAEKRIDACPMEGFDAEGFDSILGLKERSLHAAVIAAVGYRASDDMAQLRRKIRKDKKELFQMI